MVVMALVEILLLPLGLGAALLWFVWASTDKRIRRAFAGAVLGSIVLPTSLICLGLRLE
jgi:hypothetical protein